MTPKWNTFVREWWLERDTVQDTPEESWIRNDIIQLLQDTLLRNSIDISQLEKLSQLLETYHNSHYTIWSIRIPLIHIWDETILSDILSDLKASHTIWNNWDEKVLIVWNELLAKLRTKVIHVTKSKVRVLMNEWICSDRVRNVIAWMRKQLSELWVTRKELDSL